MTKARQGLQLVGPFKVSRRLSFSSYRKCFLEVVAEASSSFLSEADYMLDFRLPNADDVLLAEQRLRGVAVVTPVVRSDLLDKVTGAKVFIKLENLQHTNAFKFRGAYNRLYSLDRDTCPDGVIAYSTGNHGQAIATVGRILGIATTIVVPSDAPENKLRRASAAGATVVKYDRETQSREQVAAELAKAGRFTIVPPGDHHDVIAGQGTAVLEALREVGPNNVDAVLLPCGGGGLSAGACLAVKALQSRAEIWAVEPANFDETRRSLLTNRREANKSAQGSICDALLAATPAELPFEVNRRQLSGVFTADDDAVIEAMAFCFEHFRVVLEPGGAIGIAATFSDEAMETLRGKRVLIVASGGNVDSDLFASVITGRSEIQVG
jgi:threonine dehydratase